MFIPKNKFSSKHIDLTVRYINVVHRVGSDSVVVGETRTRHTVDGEIGETGARRDAAGARRRAPARHEAVGIAVVAGLIVARACACDKQDHKVLISHLPLILIKVEIYSSYVYISHM